MKANPTEIYAFSPSTVHVYIVQRLICSFVVAFLCIYGMHCQVENKTYSYRTPEYIEILFRPEINVVQQVIVINPQ